MKDNSIEIDSNTDLNEIGSLTGNNEKIEINSDIQAQIDFLESRRKKV